jgi:hypothetical protein
MLHVREPAITTMGGVIANAVNDAIGVRMLMLPMTPARIKEALKKRECKRGVKSLILKINEGVGSFYE